MSMNAVLAGALGGFAGTCAMNQNANQLAAQAIATWLRGSRLTREELRVAAPIVHYA